MAALLTLPLALAATPSATAAPDDGFVLTTTQTGGRGFAPAFVGNSYLPSLPPQLTGVMQNAVRWRDRVLKVVTRRDGTTVTLLSGAALAGTTPSGTRTLRPERH